jgi:hypothetical protein
MKWSLAFFLCFAASAQTPSQNAAPKLEPYQIKALENALRRPDATIPKGLSSLFTAAPHSLILTPGVQVEFAKACVIPLLSVPSDPDVDREIRRELTPEDLGADRMPVFKGLPSCGQDNQFAR